jgi:pimeloyl-ACP methyl ester carboxylesterase
MLETVQRTARGGLAYEKHGDGTPVVFLHGLTFDRTTWRAIIERLGEGVCSIAFDLPGHGDTGGEPCTLRETAARVNLAIESMGIGVPVIVGHSISSGIASIYAAAYPVRGLVNVDGTVDIRPMAELIRRLEPMLRSDRFADAFAPYQQSMGFEHVPEPLRTQTLESQAVGREVVLGYWEQLFREDPDQLQHEIEATMASIDAPCLCVFGHDLSAGERGYLQDHVPELQIEEWRDRGHLVHLAEPGRFAARLGSFIDHCRNAGERPSGERDSGNVTASSRARGWMRSSRSTSEPRSQATCTPSPWGSLPMPSTMSRVGAASRCAAATRSAPSIEISSPTCR